jgi:hypothetical protein
LGIEEAVRDIVFRCRSASCSSEDVLSAVSERFGIDIDALDEERYEYLAVAAEAVASPDVDFEDASDLLEAVLTELLGLAVAPSGPCCSNTAPGNGRL